MHPLTQDADVCERCRGDSPRQVLSLYVLPMNVSFSNIAIEEIPNMTGVHSGYFGNPQLEQLWYHTRSQGAGRWWKVEEGNCFADDEP